MCSIIGSFEKEKIVELVKLNEHRGNFSYSISLYDNGITKSIKGFGPFNFKALEELDTKNKYIIVHTQAPTNGMVNDENRIHPTVIDDTFLWHNGIIKQRSVKSLMKKYDTDNEFDTLLLHKVLPEYSNLNDIEGLFACLYVNNGIKIFRTKHAKMYVDKYLNISSERFEESKCINFDTIYSLDLEKRKLFEISRFKTKRFNIIIPGEMN